MSNDQSFNKLVTAKEIKSGSGYYNLAGLSVCQRISGVLEVVGEGLATGNLTLFIPPSGYSTLDRVGSPARFQDLLKRHS